MSLKFLYPSRERMFAMASGWRVLQVKTPKAKTWRRLTKDKCAPNLVCGTERENELPNFSRKDVHQVLFKANYFTECLRQDRFCE